MMTPVLAILEFGDFAIIAIIVAIFAGASFATKQRLDLRRVDRKLDALLKHHGIELPSPLSPEVQRLAKDPSKRLAAIKLHQEQNPGLSHDDAVKEVENFA